MDDALNVLRNPAPYRPLRFNEARRQQRIALDPAMARGIEELARRRELIKITLERLPPDSREKAEAELWAAPDDRTAAAVGRRWLDPELKRVNAGLADADKRIRLVKRQLGAAEEVLAWADGPLVLGSVESSALHQALDPLVFTLDESGPPGELKAAREACEVFLVQHDWASLLDGTDVDAGAYRLPSDLCCFEFAISGHRICAVIASSDGEPYRLIPIFKTTFGWLVLKSYALNGDAATPEWISDGDVPEGDKAIQLILAQVRAIAITLDAEVVTTTAIRAPHKLNVARIKRGEAPVFDHHILSLSRRPRLGGLTSEPTGHRKRLHFRRGHWRHYPNHKTWIRWCLVGDPSLGFADKDYRL